MKIIQEHLPSFSDRRGTKIDMVVLHYISAINTLPQDPCNLHACIKILKDYKLSYNFIIGRQGEMVELVPEAFAAWSNGVSKWKLNPNSNKMKKGTNSRSINICMVGMSGQKYTSYQYNAVIDLAGDIIKRRDIKENMFAGHEHLAPGRKTDPGKYLDWNKILDAIYRPKDNANEVLAPVVEPDPSKISNGTEPSVLRGSIITILEGLIKIVQN